MVRRGRLLTLIVIVFVTGLLSCSEEVTPIPYTYTELFTGKNSKIWTLDRLVTRVKGKNDQVEFLPICVKDDTYTFYANDERLFEVDNSQLRCEGDDTDPLLVSYTWTFNNGDATLGMVVPHIFGYFFIPFIVKHVDRNEMELEVFINEDATVSYVLYFVKFLEK